MADLKSFAEMLVNQTNKEVEKVAKILKEEYEIEPASTEDWPQTVRRTYSKKNDFKNLFNKRKKKS